MLKKFPKQLLGSILIELLISFLLISIVLAGSFKFQLSIIKQAKSNYFYWIATQQIQSISERIQSCQSCDITQILKRWNNENKEVLPKGKGNITGTFPNYIIELAWSGGSFESCQSGALREIKCIVLKLNL